MKCPICKMSNLPGSKSCDCGYRFDLSNENNNTNVSQKNIFKWSVQPLKKYATFEGRASRKEFCSFVLIFKIIPFLLLLYSLLTKELFAITISLIIWQFFIIIPYIAVAIRRLHDSNRSGVYCLLAFVPFGNIFLLVLLLKSGTKGKNVFGEFPYLR